MADAKYKLLPIDGSPKLKMRYYKGKTPLKGMIIFVHGVSHGAWCWKYFIQYLSRKGYACFALNLRGHGDDKNIQNLKHARLSDYIADVERCVNYLKLFCEENKDEITYSKPFLIGHSMGGAIVQKYISDFSDEISGAVLLAPVTAGGMNWSGILKTSFSIRGLCTTPAIMGWKTLSSLLITYSNFFSSRLSKKEARSYNEQLCKESFRAMLDLRKYSINSSIQIPILVVGSEADAYFPKDSLLKTAETYGIGESSDRLKIVSDLCHDIMLDPEEIKNKEIITYISDFIAKVIQNNTD